MNGDNGLNPSIWCGIAAVSVGAAALLVKWYVGLAVLVVGALWFGRACYLDYRQAAR
jgi:hypothetical protein